MSLFVLFLGARCGSESVPSPSGARGKRLGTPRAAASRTPARRPASTLVLAVLATITLSRITVLPAEAHDAPFTPPPLAQAFKKDLLRVWQSHFQLGQSPAIAFGQVQQESRWNADARSAFASGLSQFTPPTAQWIHAMLPADVKAACQTRSGCPLDPRWALAALGRYDRLLWDHAAWAENDRERFGFMLAGYNSGEGWVRRERASVPAEKQAHWFGAVETACLRRADFCQETRGYVHAIIERWAPKYAAWLGARP